jgi:hypothetical protein
MPKANPPTSGDRNQGEGDRDADRRYREAAAQFARSGRVPSAAAEASTSIDEDDNDDLGAAERAGKARIAEDDPDDKDAVMPTFWTPTQQTAWERVRDAVRRDWIQTKADLGLPGGHDLAQTAKDTVKQAFGDRIIPGGEAAGVRWDIARQAMRLGHGAATYWRDERWTEALETRVKREWNGLLTGVDYDDVRPLIVIGFERGKKDITLTD